MSVFKNLLKSDTPTAGSNSGTLSGQGSHFARSDEQPSTVTGTAPQTVGSSDNSASIPPASQARNTAGPEAGGSSHVGTIPARTENTGSTGASASSAKDGSGTAAIGQTTTYSSKPMASGDPTSSVVDHSSTDPLTYKIPEAAGGVPSGSAAKAASTAWKESQGDQVPGSYPSGSENPYRANHPLDPRVDGSKAGQYADSSTTSSAKPSGLGSSIGSPETSTPSRTLGSAHTGSGLDYRHGPSAGTGTAIGTGAGAGVAGLGSSRSAEHSSTTQDTSSSSVPAPSNLTSTANPTDRSAAYSDSTRTHGIDDASSNSYQTSSAPIAQTGSQPEQQGVAGRVLGALGLGGAAGAAASALGYGNKSTVDDEPRDTSAIAATPGQATLETGPPQHYRRESIPTTAYPNGPNSPRAVAPPVGDYSDRSSPLGGSNVGGSNIGGSQIGSSQIGSSQVPQSGVSHDTVGATFHDLTTTGSGSQPATHSDHTSRNVVAGGAATAVAGAGAYGLHEHNRQDPSTSTSTTFPDAGVLHGSSGTGSAVGAGSSGSYNGNTPATSTLTDRSVGSSGPGPAIGTSSSGYSQGTSTTSTLPERSHGSSGLGSAIGTGTHGTSTSSALPERSRDSSGLGSAIGTGTHGTSTSSALPDRSRDTTSHVEPRIPTNFTLGTVDDVPRSETTTTDTSSRSTGAPVSAVAAAASRYDGQDAYAPTSTTSATTSDPTRREVDHSGRNTALGAGAGGAAYAAHENSERDAARRAAEHEKDLAKQREHDQKEAAKAEKEHQKEIEHQQKIARKEEEHHQKELEKEQKHHQKEIEKEEKKEEKKHQKEIEKEEKKHHKEAEKEEKEHHAALLASQEREKARLASEEEDRKRREREAAAGVGAAAFTGAGMTAHEKHEQPHQEHQEKEKKPSIFKRIFKRRKNKDTGLDEDYSTDDEEDKAAHASRVPVHQSDSKGRTVLGAGPTGRSSVDNQRSSVDRPRDNVYTIGNDRGSSSAPLGAAAATSAAGYAGSRDSRPVEPLTGMPYDPSKDPEAARRLQERDVTTLSDPTNPSTGAPGEHHGTGYTGTSDTRDPTSTAGHGTSGLGHETGTTVGTTGTGTGLTGEPHLPATATEPFGVIGDHHR